MLRPLRIICFILLIAMVNALASTSYYWVGPDGGDFAEGDNWKNGTNRKTGLAPLHDPDNEYWGIINSGNAVLDSNSEIDLLTIGDFSDAACSVNADGNLKIWNTLYLGKLGGNGVFNINGSVYSEKLQLAQTAGSVCIIAIGDGATCTIGAGGCEVGIDGTGYINLMGSGTLVINGDSDSASLDIGNDGHIDIEQGSILQLGNWITKFQDYINSGKITAYSGTGTLNSPVYNSATGYTTLSATAGSGLASTTWYGGTGLWTVSENWNNGVPAENKMTYINGGTANITSSTANAYSITMNNSESGFLNITDSDLTVSQGLTLIAGSFMKINSGNVNIGSDIIVGDTGVCALIFNDGILNVNNNFIIGNQTDSTAALYMFGGSINIAGSFTVGQAGPATARICGTVQCNNVSINSIGIIDIATNGSLVVDGNCVSVMEDYIACKRIIADSGSSTIAVDYNLSNAGKTTVQPDYIIAYKGDLNCDGSVNLQDIAVITEQWLQLRGALPYAYIDSADDDNINLSDLAAVCQYWKADNNQ